VNFIFQVPAPLTPAGIRDTNGLVKAWGLMVAAAEKQPQLANQSTFGRDPSSQSRPPDTVHGSCSWGKH
jgi:hypothetical protein